ncbi:MAG: hypothetical protein HYZ11_05630 [Candidatus Tectomicrobia bacterium]|uniref:Uncharacterized protein n=1 Tax=Tectimicrobiota bacterium TaxID=2528274 RepID=A0A932MMU1_UNCTE|nr:hypothetical protein [Candidatus Tectomicrobia bacterium]
MFERRHPVLAPMGEFGGGGGGGGKPQSDEERIRKHLAHLSDWARRNNRDARWDFVRFWGFKLPAIASSAVSAASATVGASEQLVGVLALVAGICVAIDGLWPGGMLHNVHRRAVHDIRRLMSTAETEIDKISLQQREGSPERAAAFVEVLNKIDAERGRIGEYLANAEASLGITKESGGK